MKQEENSKQLLLKDLSSRLPYKVMIQSVGENKCLGLMDLADINSLPKPYLRPMSSMTEEEQKEFVGFHCVTLCPIIMKDCLTIENEGNMFDWLNAHYFDYRGLIEKGLAIDCTGLNVY